MYICLCTGIDENKIRTFLSTDPSDKEWQEFLSKNKISKDCGSCLPSLETLKNNYRSGIAKDPK